jgi:hypothetical protein
MYSFAQHKKTVDLHPFIRRISDLTTPNLAAASSGRSEDRFNRTIPTLLAPWENGRPSVDEISICLTTDVADRGVGLILSQPFRAKQVVVGYWISEDEMSEPWFFLADIRRNQAIGGRFWVLGVELIEFANIDQKDALAAMKVAAADLLPPFAAMS